MLIKMDVYVKYERYVCYISWHIIYSLIQFNLNPMREGSRANAVNFTDLTDDLPVHKLRNNSHVELVLKYM